jgi:di/tricarboxylate transporter
MVIGIVTGVLSLATARQGAAMALVIAGCLKVERAYESINGSVLILVGGMLPLATALDKTGVAELVAAFISDVSRGIGPFLTLLLLYLITSLITQVISNTVTGALMTPIAVKLAIAQGLAPQPFVVAIVLAVTTSYVTPMTNGDNLLIRESGRYTTRDYLINGLPVFLLQTVALMVFLLMQL